MSTSTGAPCPPAPASARSRSARASTDPAAVPHLDGNRPRAWPSSTACGASTGQHLDPSEGLNATALTRDEENYKGAGLS